MEQSAAKQVFWVCLVLLVLIAASSFAVWVAWRFLPVIWPQAGPQVGGVLASLLVSLLTLFATKRWDLKKSIQEEHRKQKAPVYQGFVNLVLTLWKSQLPGEQPLTDDEITKEYFKVAEGLTVWASNDVIKSLGEFRLGFSDSSGSRAVHLLENVLLSIRKDLGHPNDLRQGDLIRLFVNNQDGHASSGG